MHIHWPSLKKRPAIFTTGIFWLALLYVALGVVYALVTPMLEKPDEEGHYGYLRYLRAHQVLPPLSSTDQWLAESKQPPLYYVTTTLLTFWLPDEVDADALLTMNPYMDFSVPGYRNDNRNVYLHPPHLTPVVLAARLISLALGLGTVIVTYWAALLLFPKRSHIPIAAAAAVGFYPNFLYIATAVNNDAAIVFLGALITLVLLYRLKKGELAHWPLIIGALLGLASITKVSGLVFFPLVGLALLLIHRGLRPALFREGLIILAVALLIGGWWYARNAIVYDDPLTLNIHASEGGQVRPLKDRLLHDLSGIEHTFWANPARTFVSEMWIGKALIWWGRISLGLLLVSLARHWSDTRANFSSGLVLLSWPLTFLFLLLVFWNHKFRWPFGRLLYPSLVPMFLLWVLGWYYAFPARWRRLTVTLGAGALVIAGILLPFVSLYPLFHPWRQGSEASVAYPAGTLYTTPETGEPVAQLVGYNLLEPYAIPETYFPLELCWKPLGQTDTPQSVFVQLLDLSPLEAGNPPAVWGRRETYPGLGNLPTDRWTLDKTFCDTMLVWVYADTPAPLGAAIEVGFIDRETGTRLQPVTPEGDPMGLAFSGSLSILTAEVFPDTEPTSFYTWDDAIALNQVHTTITDTTTLTFTWQSLRAVPYDATMFLHVTNAQGDTISQVDRQPLEGLFPTSFWIPGQVITDVVTLPADAHVGTAFNLGLYTWPSLQRLPVVDASGSPQPEDAILLTLPPDGTAVTWP